MCVRSTSNKRLKLPWRTRCASVLEFTLSDPAMALLVRNKAFAASAFQTCSSLRSPGNTVHLIASSSSRPQPVHFSSVWTGHPGLQISINTSLQGSREFLMRWNGSACRQSTRSLCRL